MRYTFMSDGYAAVNNDVCYEDQNEDYCGDAIDKLAAYEDAEEHGLLIRLPCKVGDVVYLIREERVWEVKVESIHQWVSGRWVESIHQWVSGSWKVSARTLGTFFTSYEIDFDGFGKTVFLSREEAEAALKGKEADNGV